MTLEIQNPSNGRQSRNLVSGLQDPKSIEEAFDIADEEILSPDELAQIWAERAHVLAEEPPSTATGQTMDLLVFWLSDERHGIEVTNVREIHPLEQLTPVPRTPDFVAGVFSARGRILSVLDLRPFFGLPALNLSDQTKILVVTNTNSNSDAAQSTEFMEVGILADQVEDVVTIFKETIEPPLTTHTGTRAEYIQGITPDMLVVLKLNALLNDERLIVQEEIL